MSAYAKNGSDPEAVKNRLMGKGNCHCKRSAAGCHRSVPLGPLRHVCATFWSLTDQERAFAVRAMYLESATSDVRGPHDAQAGQDSDSPDTVPRNVQWALVGTPVCFHTWCHLLGTSSKAIRKYIQGMHDLRRHGRKIAPGTVLNPQGQHVDFFFYEVYCSAAEPLPETPAAADGDKGDADISHKLGPWDVLADIELHDDDWNPDFPSVDLFTRLTTASQSRVVGLPARYLPHGRLHDLYWMFLSAWDFLASAERSDVTTSGKPPSFVTFWRRWQVWKTHLKFRKSSQHAQCQTCWELQQQMHTPTTTWADRMQAARLLRTHYRQQCEDRCIYWSLRHASQQGQDVLCIIIDSMDRSKFAWPRWGFDRRPKSLESAHRPRVVVTAAIAHGFCTTIHWASEQVNHGANAFCEVLARTLERVWAICRETGRPFPRHLIVQSDNTVAQALNSVANMFLASLVARNKFTTANLFYLLVGHTHEDVPRPDVGSRESAAREAHARTHARVHVCGDKLAG